MFSTALILTLLIIPLSIDGQNFGNQGLGRILRYRPRNLYDEQPESHEDVPERRTRVSPHREPVVEYEETDIVGEVRGDVYEPSDSDIERFNAQAAAPSESVAGGDAEELVPFDSASSTGKESSSNVHSGEVVAGGDNSASAASVAPSAPVAPSASVAPAAPATLAPFVFPTFAPFVFPTVPPIAPSGPSAPAVPAPASFVFPGIAPFPVAAQGVASSAGGSAAAPAPAPAPFAFPTLAPLPAPAQGAAAAPAPQPAAPAPFAFPTFAPFPAAAPGVDNALVTPSPFAFPTFGPLTAAPLFPDFPGSTLFPLSVTALPPAIPGLDYSYGYKRIDGQNYDGVAVGQPGNMLYIFCANCPQKK